MAVVDRKQFSCGTRTMEAYSDTGSDRVLAARTNGGGHDGRPYKSVFFAQPINDKNNRWWIG